MSSTAAERASLLHVDTISKSFSGLKAVSDFRLDLRQGDLQGLIGPNGAGKTTVFNLLTGVYVPDSGSIRLGEQRLDGLRPSAIAEAGVARTFQNIRLFGQMSVLDNVRLAFHMRSGIGLVGSMLRLPGAVRREEEIEKEAMDLLSIFNLANRAQESARNLPYGDQRRLEIARALATRPRVLLLDEPAAGMNPQEKVALKDLIRQVRDRFGLTVLLIEHDMGLVMDICETITVIDHGVTISVGPPAKIQEDPAVISAYLGVPDA